VRVLVTGASGFIGQRCLPRLIDAGMDVHALSRTGRVEGDRVPVHIGDVFDKTSIDRCLDAVRPTHLLHLAWFTEHGAFWESERNDEWLRASLDLAESFVRRGGLRVVVAGTCAEYRWDGTPCSEVATSLDAATRYGRAKHQFHVELEALAERTGVEVAWGRVFFAYGRGEDPRKLFSSLARGIISGRPVRVRTPHRKLDFVHVDDVADAFAQLLDHPAAGTVNIASGVATEVQRAVRTIGDLLNLTPLLDTSEFETEPDVTAETTWTPRNLRDGLADLLEEYPQVSNRR
jgi:nucleoside-diphosphate-sugar epimerase